MEKPYLYVLTAEMLCSTLTWVRMEMTLVVLEPVVARLSPAPIHW